MTGPGRVTLYVAPCDCRGLAAEPISTIQSRCGFCGKRSVPVEYARVVPDRAERVTLWVCEVCGHREVATDECGKCCEGRERPHEEQVMVWIEYVRASGERA